MPVKTALVTGHRGFVGRHITAALVNDGYTLTGVDIAAGDDARDYFRNAASRYDLAVHCAAIVGGRAKIEGAPLALAANLELDAAMFGWAARTRPGRVVYLSSSAVYPLWLQDSPGGLLTEEDVDLGDPALPDQLYGWAKLTGEHLAARARAAGVPVTVVRPFSGYGEDQDETYPFPAFAARARRREDPFTVWGDGAQVRDFIHVDDICAAILKMAAECIGGPANLGTGRATSMADLAAMMCAAAGYRPAVKTIPHMPSGVAWRVADTARMSGFYTPRITLEEGIARALG